MIACAAKSATEIEGKVWRVEGGFYYTTKAMEMCGMEGPRAPVTGTLVTLDEGLSHGELV